MRNAFKERLAAGDRLIGAWCNLATPHAAEIAGRAGFDFVVIDFQHGFTNEGDAADMFRAVEATGAAPIARAGNKEAAHLGRLLDLDAAALIIPMVDSARDASETIRACLYPPAGTRSFGPIRTAYSGRRNHDLAEAADNVCLLPMIETKGGIRDIEAITATPGVAGLFVGPADLSLALGLSPARDHSEERFQKALESIVAACRKNGVASGIQADRSLAARRFKQGFSCVTAAMDNSDLAASFRNTLHVVHGSISGCEDYC